MSTYSKLNNSGSLISEEGYANDIGSRTELVKTEIMDKKKLSTV